MQTYQITMNNSDVRTMIIVDENSTIEGEIAKWPDAVDVVSWVEVE